MSNGDIQQPRTQYPGAEFFALQPNRTIALGQRLSTSFAPANISVPASSTATLIGDLTLQGPLFPNGSALAVIRSWVLYNPADATGELQIIGARLGVGLGGGGIIVDFGIPTATFIAPGAAQVAIYDRDLLVTEQDLTFGGFTGGPAILSGVISVKNLDTTNPHSFGLRVFCIWHQLAGFTT